MVRSCFCFFKQKTAYEMRISDWSSDVCSSDLRIGGQYGAAVSDMGHAVDGDLAFLTYDRLGDEEQGDLQPVDVDVQVGQDRGVGIGLGDVEPRAAGEDHQRAFQQPHRHMVVDEIGRVHV